MIKTGIIPLQNIHGVICHVTYLYDQALDEYKLIPQKRFTDDDIRRVNEIMPHTTKAYILADIAEKLGRQSLEICMSTPSRCCDRATCGLSGSR